jgi:putative lipase involved disintegration of autophagic bodies
MMACAACLLGCLQVHSGFLTAYDSIRPAVLSVLRTMLRDEGDDWRLYFTGHSLGGALATLCAWDCSHRK